ncbi:MAG TPA: hypothetical protein ENK31_02915 [Nannocystis exedens]|nr:hypothetical protein [Nannocystis exedens]
MLVRITVAALVALAPLRLPAASPESKVLAQEAAGLAKRATAEEDPKIAAITAFEAHNLWRQAFEMDGDRVHLCKARSLLTAICARSEFGSEFRASLERSRDALPKCRRSGPSQKRSRSRASQKRPKRIEPSQRLPDALVVLEPPQVDPPLVGSDREQAHFLSDPGQAELLPQHPGRAFQVVGGASLALGVLAFGVMIPFAVRDAANARAIDLLAAKNEVAGRLTTEDAQRVAELIEDSRMTFRLSLALGLAGGIATVLGASLLITGQGRSVSLAPRADRNSASISLQGRF